jgi:DnaJ-class molecular chaperone
MDSEQEQRRVRCQRCRGNGIVYGITKVRPGTGMGFDPGPCPECDGVGYVEAADDLAAEAIRVRRHRESRRTRQ